MVRAALVVSVTQRAGTRARGFVRAVPAEASASADGGGGGEQPVECTDSAAAGTATVVRDALVVSAGRRGEHAPVNDAWRDPRDAGRHHASTADDSSGHDAATTAVGHVFCLSASVKRYVWRRGWQSRGAARE
jgi:hypothetical protein